MSFPSEYAHLIWDKLYTCRIPDQVTQRSDYLSKFGAYVTGDKKIDSMLSTATTQVMIPVATILSYFEDGVQVEILKREDMIQMHKDIELYLGEWKGQIKYNINVDVVKHKAFLLSLEKLSKHIHGRAKDRDIVDNLFLKPSFGLRNPSVIMEEERKPMTRPDYEGIAALVRSKTKPQGRY